MGKLRVYCLKTLNKLSIYSLGNTPSAPSETQLLMRDIASIEETGGEVTSKLLSQTTPTSFSFIGSRESYDRHTTTSANPPNSRSRSWCITPQQRPYDTCSSSFPMHSVFMFHICMSSPLLFGLHGSPIQPLWLRSILIGCSTRLVFSKKRPYGMVLMPVYVEMAEGLVKPLVILPAADMPLSSFILIFSRRYRPLCSDWFIRSHDPLHPVLHYKPFPRSLSPLSPPHHFDLLWLGILSIYGRTM